MFIRSLSSNCTPRQLAKISLFSSLLLRKGDGLLGYLFCGGLRDGLVASQWGLLLPISRLLSGKTMLADNAPCFRFNEPPL